MNFCAKIGLLTYRSPRLMPVSLNDLNDGTKRQMFKNLFEQYPCLYGIKDLDSRFIVANDTMAKWTGYSNGYEVMDKQVKTEEFKCKTAALAEVVYKEDKAVIQSQKQQQFLGFTEFADNKWYLLFGTKTPVIDSSGNTIALIDQFTDVTYNPLMNLSSIMDDHQFIQSRFIKERQFSYTITDSIEQHNISKRQLECLYYLMRGKSSSEIGATLGLSKRTVETHMENIKLKLNCYTKSEIIDKAISKGFLNFIPRRLLSGN